MTAKVAKVMDTIRRLSPKERGELAGALAKFRPKKILDELLDDVYDLRMLRETRKEPTRPYDEFAAELRKEGRL